MKKGLTLILVAVAAASFVIWLTHDNTAEAQAPNVPVGSVVAWSGPKSKIPSGWVEYEVRELNRTQFQSLFDAICTTWGGTATYKFKAPDRRRFFLMVVDDLAVR